MLLLDGHSSHHTPEFLRFALENNIVILGYPPHCTHALQGLDVVCFARMKEVWKEVLSDFEKASGEKVGKGDFTALFGKAYLKVFTAETVQAAFWVTGVYPYDPTIITVQQMKLSEVTSTKGCFLLPQPSPVRAIIKSFSHFELTAADLDPNNFPTQPLTPVTP